MKSPLSPSVLAELHVDLFEPIRQRTKERRQPRLWEMDFALAELARLREVLDMVSEEREAWKAAAYRAGHVDPPLLGRLGREGAG